MHSIYLAITDSDLHLLNNLVTHLLQEMTDIMFKLVLCLLLNCLAMLKNIDYQIICKYHTIKLFIAFFVPRYQHNSTNYSSVTSSLIGRRLRPVLLWNRYKIKHIDLMLYNITLMRYPQWVDWSETQAVYRFGCECSHLNSSYMWRTFISLTLLSGYSRLPTSKEMSRHGSL